MLVRYDPIEKPLYEVGPGLKPLGHDLGQGSFDHQIFQIDDLFPISRQNKIDCLRENSKKYHLTDQLTPEIERAFVLFLIERLSQESPQHFTVHNFDHEIQLRCHLTSDLITVDPNGHFLSFRTRDEKIISAGIKIETALDAFALQIQEDLALCRVQGEHDSLCALHVCSPSHWSPEEKIGKSFVEIHAPVPGIEKLNRTASQMVQAMIHKGPFVRFVWSFVTDRRLNHHPDAPPAWDPTEWKGRSFQIEKDPPFHLRVERQTTFGFPHLNFALFTIRVSFWDGNEIRMNEKKCQNLLGVLHSMSPASRRYKGVADCFAELIAWLEKKP